MAANTQYTTPAVTGATTYTWSISGDPQTIVSGQGTRTIVLKGANTGGSTVEVTPGNGTCTGAKATLGITVFNNPQLDNYNGNNPQCGQENGSLTLTMNGTGPFEYIWSNGDTVSNPQGLIGGIYIVTISDQNNCSIDSSFKLSDVGGPIISSNYITQETCYKKNDGGIDISMATTGGTRPFKYMWSTGDTNEDISNLQPGGYRVVVTDSIGCQTSDIIFVEAGQKIEINSTIKLTSGCGLNDGEIEIDETYYDFNWNSTTIDTSKLTGLSAGSYFVTISNSSNCSLMTHFDISDTNGPTLVLDSMNMVNCKSTDGAIYITGSFSSSLTYKWSDNSIIEDLTGVTSGIYTVTATGGSCKGVMTKRLNTAPPMVNELCLVTVDDSSRRNLVAFEKVQRTGINGYNVYRESWDPGVSIKIGFIPIDSVSWWIDPSADPLLKPWKYQIGVLNDCGVESDLSSVHQTTHLVVKKSDTTESNLTWSNYVGFSYPKVYIDRYTDTSGWKTIDSVNFNVTSYKDANPPFDKTLSYAVGVNYPGSCFASRAAGKTLNSSRSNRAAPPSVKFLGDTNTTEPTDTTIGLRQVSTDQSISLFPNPSEGEVNLVVNKTGIYSIEVISMTGEVVFAEGVIAETDNEIVEIDLSMLQAGVYFIAVKVQEIESAPPTYIRLVIQ